MQNRSRDQSAVWSIHHFETVKDPNEIKVIALFPSRINKHQFSFKLVLTIYKYPNRIFLKTKEKPLHWKSNLHRWGIKPSSSVVMVNLRALKYSMSFAKGIDCIAFCFLGRLYCYTWRVRALHSIHPSPADESIQIIDDTSCFIYCTISVAYYFKFFNLESILMWSNDSCSL